VTEKENIGDLYRDATDSTRSLVGVRHEAPKQNRVKPDEETRFEPASDFEKEPTRVEQPQQPCPE
jgi:hypothetical protein